MMTPRGDRDHEDAAWTRGFKGLFTQQRYARATDNRGKYISYA
jgi:hypothetical protein